MNFAQKQKHPDKKNEKLRRQNEQGDVTSELVRDHPNPAIQRDREIIMRSANNHDESIQAKLVVGSPNDKFEQEADATAEYVMSRPKRPLKSFSSDGEDVLPERDSEVSNKRFLQTVLQEDRENQDTSLSVQKREMISMSQFVEAHGIQKKEESGDFYSRRNTIQMLLNYDSGTAQRNDQEEEENLQEKSEETSETQQADQLLQIDSELRRTKFGGVPMSNELLQEMEARFGNVDFSQVRIHTDLQAIEMCARLNARAFTHGNHIYFNEGQFNSSTHEGKLLLAHELTHTIHQGASSKKIQKEQIEGLPEMMSKAGESNLIQRSLIDIVGLIDRTTEELEKLYNTPGWVNNTVDLNDYMFTSAIEEDNEVIIFKPLFSLSPEEDSYIMYHYLKTVFRADDAVIWNAINKHENPTNFVEAYSALHEEPINKTVVSVTIPITNESFLLGLRKLYTQGRPDIESLLDVLELYPTRFTWLDQRNIAGLTQHIHRISPLEFSAYFGMLNLHLDQLTPSQTLAKFIVKSSGVFHANLEAFRADKIAFLEEKGILEQYLLADDPVKFEQLTNAVERINLINPPIIKSYLDITAESSWEPIYAGNHPGDSQLTTATLLSYFSGIGSFSDTRNNPIFDSFLFSDIDKGLSTTGHSRAEIFDFVHLFQEQSMRLAFQMIKSNQDLLLEEYIHYQDDDEIARLFSLIGNNFVNPYNEGNLVRAKGLKKLFSSKYGKVINGINIADMTETLISVLTTTVLFNTPLTILDLGMTDRIFPILRRLFHLAVDDMAIAMQDYSRYAIMSEVRLLITIKDMIDRDPWLLATAGMISPEVTIRQRFPKLVEADRMDDETDQRAREMSIEDFPIMADLSVDPREITYAAKNARSYDQFRKFIHGLIAEKYQNGNDLKEELKDNPEKVWELDGLLLQTKEVYGIYEGSIADQIVNDISKDIADAKFWRDIFLGAVGIILAVAGLFTGGLTTVLGAGLIVAGAAVSITEFIIAKNEYDFAVMSSDTAIGVANELSYKEPNALGMILAMIGMGLDLISLIKVMGKVGGAIAKSAKTAKLQGAFADAYKALDTFFSGARTTSTMSRADIEKALRPLYDELGTEATSGFARSFDEFVDNMIDVFKKQKDSVSKLDPVLAKLSPDAAARMDDIQKVGWSKLWDDNPELAKRLFKGFENDPNMIQRIAMEAILEENTASKISRLESLLGGKGWLTSMTTSRMRRVMEYLLKRGNSTWSELPDILAKFERLGSPSEAFVEAALTQSRLRKLLTEGDQSVEALYSLWNKFHYGGGNRLGQSFVEFAENGFRRAAREAEVVEEATEAAQDVTKISNSSSKVKTRGVAEEQLTDIGRYQPVPLTPSELAKVNVWTAFRNKYLKKWRTTDISDLPEETRRLLYGTADNSVRKNMTPDDLAAVLKEQRGIQIMKPDGVTPYRHLASEWPQAKTSILNTIKRIRKRLLDLEEKGITDGKEVELLKDKWSDLSTLLDEYTKSFN